MKNILFYKFVKIDDVEQFREEHFKLCFDLKLKGKILVAHEGINGCLSGDNKQVDEYMRVVKKDPRFSDIEFKEREVEDHTFRKLFVRIRNEIITFKQDSLDVEKTVNYIEPEQLKKMYEKDEEFYIIDTRNNYESRIGKFKNAITPDIDIFSKFPDVLDEYSHLKDKKVVIYCTGGIRCEKAGALMKEKGFQNVSQLHGGIIRYGDVCSSDYWEGKCFVFDERVAIEVDPSKKSQPITACKHCVKLEDTYHNCQYVDCDKRFIACEECVKELQGCCSEKCKRKFNTLS